MHVGLIAPPWMPVPPTSYGGTEAVVDNLACALADLGHDVRLFTVGCSTCPVPQATLFGTPAEPINSSVHEAAHVLAAYDALADTDVIHDHTTLGPLLGAVSHPRRPPIIVTHHGLFTRENRRIYGESARHASVVAISQSQADGAAEVAVTAVIHHGIDLDLYSPGDGGGDGGYLLWVGRMNADKGAHRAIRIARRGGRPLVILAKMREEAERAYFEARVEPLLDDDVTVHFEPSMEQRLDVQRGALALLNPITWPEPFGLVMVEALATATPVIAYRNGAAPEIVDDGATGFLCDDEGDMVTAIGRLGEIERSACRDVAEKRFSRQRMASDYVDLYARACMPVSA